jgi:hypothetical protein
MRSRRSSPRGPVADPVRGRSLRCAHPQLRQKLVASTVVEPVEVAPIAPYATAR